MESLELTLQHLNVGNYVLLCLGLKNKEQELFPLPEIVIMAGIEGYSFPGLRVDEDDLNELVRSHQWSGETREI